MVAEEVREGGNTALASYGKPLMSVSSSEYLGRVMSDLDDYWTEVVAILRKARKKWASLSRVLGWEGADSRALGNFYIAVVQVVLLFGSEAWVMCPLIGRTLGGFCHRVIR